VQQRPDLVRARLLEAELVRERLRALHEGRPLHGA
jgi:hypothetical protein